MSIQVSTRIDAATKQRFDAVCSDIGISPSSALSMFIKSVINHNGIPFNILAPRDKTPVISSETATDQAPRPPFEYGSMSGKVWMADDFDAPLDDFREYMQ